MFPAIRDRKAWWLTAVAFAISSYHLFDRWDELWAGENYAPAALLVIVPLLAIYLLINISALRLSANEPRSEGN